MKAYEFKRIYHPKFGQFVFKHKGSGLIVDNIFKPATKMLNKVSQMLIKPLAKKVLKSGIEHAGDKIGKWVVEKAGETIMKRLHGSTKPKRQSTLKPATSKQKTEDYNIILNRLISGTGFE